MGDEPNSVLLANAELWANNYNVTKEALLYIKVYNNSVSSDDDSDSVLMETAARDVAQVFIQSINTLSDEDNFDEEYFVEECLKKSKVAGLDHCALSRMHNWLREVCQPLAYRAVVARGVISGFDLNVGFLENTISLQDAAVVFAAKKMTSDYRENSPFHKLIDLHFSAPLTSYYTLHFLVGSNAEIVAGYPGEWTVFSDDNILTAFCLMSIACYREMLVQVSDINECVDWASNLASHGRSYDMYKVISGELPVLNAQDKMIVEGMTGILRRLTSSIIDRDSN